MVLIIFKYFDFLVAVLSPFCIWESLVICLLQIQQPAYRDWVGRNEMWCYEGFHNCSPVPLGVLPFPAPMPTLNPRPRKMITVKCYSVTLKNALLFSLPLITYCLPQLYKRWGSCGCYLTGSSFFWLDLILSAFTLKEFYPFFFFKFSRGILSCFSTPLLMYSLVQPASDPHWPRENVNRLTSPMFSLKFLLPFLG